MEFMTIKEAAEKWNLSVRRVQTICNEGMIEGAMKFGNTWAIPKNAVKPADTHVFLNSLFFVLIAHAKAAAP